MRDIWVISDTHFGHKNIVKFKDDNGELIRGKVFPTIEEHDEALIENWNKTVKDGDIVYNLGDVHMMGHDNYVKLHHKLKGAKRLIVGNHDDIKKLSGVFAKVQMWRMWPEFGLLFTHVPIHESGLYRYAEGDMLKNIHGHIHHHESPTEHHCNVSCEAINYTPINIEELRKW